jgi:hypothetical protein
MGQINICNSAGRDAMVTAVTVGAALKVRWCDDKGRQANSVRLLKAPIHKDVGALQAQFGELGQVSEALLEQDPEIDLEQTGRFLRETQRVYVGPDGQVVHRAEFWDVIRNPDGSERERRPRRILDANIAGELPLRWTGKFIPKEEACRKFVFSGKVQLQHINGLTYDFLFAMAKELEDKKSLMFLGAGPKANQPLVLRRGSSPYRGFLEGRTSGEKYLLVLHLSNLELKAPDAAPKEEPEA